MSDDEDNKSDDLRRARARQQTIGDELRRLWDGVLREPIPDDMADLLAQLDERFGKEKLH